MLLGNPIKPPTTPALQRLGGRWQAIPDLLHYPGLDSRCIGMRGDFFLLLYLAETGQPCGISHKTLAQSLAPTAPAYVLTLSFHSPNKKGFTCTVTLSGVGRTGLVPATVHVKPY